MSACKTLFALCTAAVAAMAVASGVPNAYAQERGQCFKTERDSKFYPTVRGCSNDDDRQCRVVLEEGHAVRFLSDRGDRGDQWWRVQTIVGDGYIRSKNLTQAGENRCHRIPRN